MDTTLTYGCENDTIAPAYIEGSPTSVGTQIIIGSGDANTALLVAGCSDANFAAKACDDLVSGGKSDWFLPSGFEMFLFFNNMVRIGNPLLSTYFTSTEIFQNTYPGFHLISMYNNNYGGRLSNGIKSNSTAKTRAIRKY